MPIPKVSSFLSEGTFRSMCSLWLYQLRISPCIFCVFFSLLPCNAHSFTVIQWFSCKFKKRVQLCSQKFLFVYRLSWTAYREYKEVAAGPRLLVLPSSDTNCSKYTEPRCQKKGAGDQGWAIRRGRYLLVDICGERDSTVKTIIQRPWARKLHWSQKAKLWHYKKLLNWGVK